MEMMWPSPVSRFACSLALDRDSARGSRFRRRGVRRHMPGIATTTVELAPEPIRIPLLGFKLPLGNRPPPDHTNV